MRCSCRECGVYMVQEEYGLQSGCKCPACGAMCHDCMGSAQQPLSTDEIKGLFAFGLMNETQLVNAEKRDDTTEIEEAGLKDWRKNL